MHIDKDYDLPIYDNGQRGPATGISQKLIGQYNLEIFTVSHVVPVPILPSLT